MAEEVKKEAKYKAVGPKCGRQLPESTIIIRPNALGYYEPTSAKEVAFLESLVKTGVVVKE